MSSVVSFVGFCNVLSSRG